MSVPIYERVGYEIINIRGELMRCIKYNSSKDVIVEFPGKYYSKRKTWWSNFIKGKVINLYSPSIYGIGITGDKYLKTSEHKNNKIYRAWHDMLYRVTEEFKKDNPTYRDVTCCDEWIYLDNFYEWIINQTNYDKWENGTKWCLDKDILFKGNKIYAPDKCCLVPNNVNTLFVKKDANRGDLPIGVTKNHDRYMSMISDPFIGKNNRYLGTYDTPFEAFEIYKTEKEKIIKMVANKEFESGNITEQCYEAMMSYQVDITD